MSNKITILFIFALVLVISLAACTTTASPTQEPVATSVMAATATPMPSATVVAPVLSYPIVDTGQGACYDNGEMIDCPAEGEAFYGQDAQFTGNAPSYTDNGDGTVTDNVTGLMWQQSPDTNGDGAITVADKKTYTEAVAYCENLSLGGYDDWRLPSIKQLYSLVDFSGKDPSGYTGADTSGLIPFIDTDTFDFAYGDTSDGERIIDSQYASTNLYTGDAYEDLLFGYNFADGRIKGYGLTLHGQDKTFTVACVRGNSDYGVNDFVDNGDGTITDNATGLMWAQDDSGAGMTWEEALAWVQQMSAENYLGYSDWRLPNAKELQSIVDYSRSPDATGSAAIDPLFNTTSITNEAGETDYGFYWTGTTHANWTDQPGSNAVYISFGRAMGYMNDVWQDVHGAGAQRSDPKTGDPADWPTGNGPQGDAIRITNFVRLVRGGNVTETPAGNPDMSRETTVLSVNTSGQAAEQVTAAEQQPPEIDLAAAAQTLGITEEALQAALGDPTQGPPDFAAAAQTLGISEETLLDALGISGQPGGGSSQQTPSYPIVDTNQGTCYNNSEAMDCPAEGEPFYGQDAQFTGNVPSYTDNGDGTVTDNVTGLIWTQDLSSYSMPWSDASAYCESLDTGGITDWRLPSLKELWAIRDFSTGWPWVDTDYFHLVGDGSVLAQHHSWTSNLYLVESEYQNQQVQGDPAFIVNDWTGHIKAMSGNRFVRCVSGDAYGINDFVDNGDGTVTDRATGLMWAQNDNGEAVDWETALAYAQEMNAANYLGYNDWRLPNIKELQSIADYSGVFPSMDTSVFNLTELTNVVYDPDTGEEIATQVTYPGYWSSTSNPAEGGSTHAWLLVVGYNTDPNGYDLHGAGSVVFDTKAESVSDGSDIEVVYHYVRLVRGGDVVETPAGDPSTYRGDDPTRVVSFPDGDIGNIGAGGPGGQPLQIDLAAAAQTLGITEEALQAALGDPTQGPPDFAAAAQTLGISEETLLDALGISGQPGE